jgi:hypothetical protein
MSNEEFLAKYCPYWLGNVVFIGKARNACRILLGKPEKKKLVRPSVDGTIVLK